MDHEVLWGSTTTNSKNFPRPFSQTAAYIWLRTPTGYGIYVIKSNRAFCISEWAGVWRNDCHPTHFGGKMHLEKTHTAVLEIRNRKLYRWRDQTSLLVRIEVLSKYWNFLKVISSATVLPSAKVPLLSVGTHGKIGGRGEEQLLNKHMNGRKKTVSREWLGGGECAPLTP